MTEGLQVVGTLPAGQYYIGDPCYAIRGDDEWTSFLKAYWKAEDQTLFAAVFEFNGRPCFVCSTNTGDGGYTDQTGEVYGVDAGLIGAVPVEVMGWPSGRKFEHPFEVSTVPGRWNEDGKPICIGDITIET